MKKRHLGSGRDGAAAVGSPAAVHHPVARLEQAQTQRAAQVARPIDAQSLWLGSRLPQRTHGHLDGVHLSGLLSSEPRPSKLAAI